MRRLTIRSTCLSAIAALAILVGCGGNDATAPRYQPQVTNIANSFAFQVTGLQRVTDNIVYTWRNDGTTANVNQSPAGLQGTATLVVSDAVGVQVYSRALAENGTFVTTSGTSGNWTIRVQFSSASGTSSFSLQKP